MLRSFKDNLSPVKFDYTCCSDLSVNYTLNFWHFFTCQTETKQNKTLNCALFAASGVDQI